jgi:hypothetical protein
MQRHHGPFLARRRPQFAGKRLGGPGSAPFGAGMGSNCFFHAREKYCRNGGMTFPHQVRAQTGDRRQLLLGP